MSVGHTWNALPNKVEDKVAAIAEPFWDKNRVRQNMTHQKSDHKFSRCRLINISRVPFYAIRSMLKFGLGLCWIHLWWPCHHWQVDGRNSFELFLLSLRKFWKENVSKKYLIGHVPNKFVYRLISYGGTVTTYIAFSISSIVTTIGHVLLVQKLNLDPNFSPLERPTNNGYFRLSGVLTLQSPLRSGWMEANGKVEAGYNIILLSWKNK